MRFHLLATGRRLRTKVWLGMMLLSASLSVQAPAQAQPLSAGVEWTARVSGSTQSLQAVQEGNGQVVVVGNKGTILTSADGKSWQSRSSGTQADLTAVTYGGGLFVATGSGGTILTSSDGREWSAVPSGTTARLRDILYAADRFVAVGYQGTILTSADGLDWTPMRSGTAEALSAVAYGAGQFAAVGANGTILTSSDGTRWSSRTAGTASPLTGIAYGGGLFLAVGQNGAALTSDDGVTWTGHRPGEFSYALWTVTYGDGIFVAAGGSGAVAATKDGETWVKYDTGRSYSFLNGIGYIGGQFVAVGDSGTIRTSGGSALQSAAGTTSPSRDLPADAAATDDHFTMPEGLEGIFVVLSWDQGDADFSLIRPDGQVITPLDAPETSDTMNYVKNDVGHEAFYAVAAPMPGTWGYSVRLAGATTYSLRLIEPKMESHLALTAPATDITGTGPVTIRWKTDAPAGSTISLFYRTATDTLGFPFATDLDAQSGSYVWTPDGVRPGTYTIYAFLHTEHNGFIEAEAPGRVRIGEASSPWTTSAPLIECGSRFSGALGIKSACESME